MPLHTHGEGLNLYGIGLMRLLTVISVYCGTQVVCWSNEIC